MDRAKIALFEDDPEFISLVRRVLKDTPHTIVAEATTRDEALSLVQTPPVAPSPDFNVVLLDGNLADSVGQRVGNGSDARAIFDSIKRRRLQVHILGFSATRMIDYGLPLGGDFDPGKTGTRRLPGILDALPEIS